METTELIKNKIYYVQYRTFWMIGLVTLPNYSNNNFSEKRGDATIITQEKIFKKNTSWCYKASNRTFRLATFEEKHWLNECIKQNKFIEFDEAMKSFIPKYMKAIDKIHSQSEVVETIYKTSELPNWVVGHSLESFWKCYKIHYKPSTKEAYDAQFVVKKELETPKDKVLKFKGFKLPEIEKVESSEGAIYQLGDKITVFTKNSPNKGKLLIIKGFRWNNAKTNICAITEIHTPNGIGLNLIELYSEPVVKDSFVLPEKWYFKLQPEFAQIVCDYVISIKPNYTNWIPKNILTNKYISNDNMCCLASNNYKYGTQITFEQFEQYVLHNGFKVGDRFSKQKSSLQHIFNLNKKIIDLQYINNQSIAFYNIIENNYINSHYKILTKNIVK